MAQVHAHRLTKYVHIQNKLGPDQTTKRAICKACESKEQIFKQGKNEGIELWEVYQKYGFINRWDRVQRHWRRCPYWREFWVDEDQEVITYEDPDENMARNAVRALQQARERNNTAMSVVSSNSRTSNISESMLSDNISETSSPSQINEIKKFKTKKNNYT
ncbi:hypothetical protein C2G38_2265689 [Gigaspora rosea]|uniref:Uncharacterized protein n=1 Tax=Gigaspora rosea TaxID=44941 RepID=A0A397UIY1_9GLOM|nr:hypothetical protein C2G38_2265689 [Gigaspora rosea]